MLKRLSLLMLSLCSLIAFSQEDRGIRLDSGELPFEMIKNTILIPVTLGGEEYKFVFDTGGFLSISEEIRNKNQLAATDSILVSDVNGFGQYFDMVELEKVGLGDLEFKGREALVIYDNADYPENCFGAEGMIGRDFFDGLLIQLDYQKRTLRMVNDSTKIQPEKKYRIKMRTSERGIPDVLLNINGKEGFVEFDSGSGDFFSFKTKSAKRLKGISKEEKLRFKGIFSYGVSSKSRVGSSLRYRPKVKSLKLGPTEFVDFYSNFSKQTEPRIGASILYYGRVTMDFQNMWFYFEPYEEELQLPSFETFGFDIVYLHDEYLIKWVLQASQAEQEGLAYGQKVIAINGQTVENFNEDPCLGYLNGYPFQEKEEVEIVVVDEKGGERKVVLKKLKY
jgi:hypothetical protein